jgi:hypothetical protein
MVVPLLMDENNDNPIIIRSHIVLTDGLQNILIPNVAEKNILILVEEKKNNLIQSFCHITQCSILEQNCALCATKK